MIQRGLVAQGPRVAARLSQEASANMFTLSVRSFDSGSQPSRRSIIEALEDRRLLSAVLPGAGSASGSIAAAPVHASAVGETLPNSPFALTATATSANSVQLKFYDTSNVETGFLIGR